MAEKEASEIHRPVLLAEALEALNIERGGRFVDATLGLGGHAEAILARSETTFVLGIDQDEAAIDHAKARLARFGDRVKCIRSNFSELRSVLRETGLDKVDGIVADLGVSSLQFDSPERGFSFRFDAPLDMRMNPSSDEPNAAELLATLSETEIANLIYRFGEERFSRRIARRIVERREAGDPVRTTYDLAGLVERSVPRKPKDKIHPATKTFQALRIAVNRELEILERFLSDAIDALNVGGRLAVISFHSLEDRIIKHMFQRMSGRCSCPPRIPRCVCGAVRAVTILTRKPVVPADDEIEINPRARSAKLRAVEKILES